MLQNVAKPNRLVRGLAFLGNMGAIIFPLGAIALVSVPAIWIYQLQAWIVGGHWPGISLADGLRRAGIAEPRFASATLQHANEDLLAAPLSLVLLFGIGGFLFAYAQFSKWLERHCEPEKAAIG